MGCIWTARGIACALAISHSLSAILGSADAAGVPWRSVPDENRSTVSQTGWGREVYYGAVLEVKKEFLAYATYLARTPALASCFTSNLSTDC